MSTPHDVGTEVGTDAVAEAQDSPRPRRPRGGSGGEKPAQVRPVEVVAPEREPDSEPAGVSEPDPAAGTKGGPSPAAVAPSLEAVLISSDRAVAVGRLVEVLAPSFPTLSAGGLRRVVEHLNEAYAREGRAFRVESVSGGLRIMTLPQHAEVLARFHGQRAQTRLSRAAIETLAIVAYKQPITRAEIEAIRGVASGEILKTLMDRRLVTITGRAEELGRPMLYGTTRQFLDTFGLSTLKDLPPPEDFGLKT